MSDELLTDMAGSLQRRGFYAGQRSTAELLQLQALAVMGEVGELAGLMRQRDSDGLRRLQDKRQVEGADVLIASGCLLLGICGNVAKATETLTFHQAFDRSFRVCGDMGPADEQNQLLLMLQELGAMAGLLRKMGQGALAYDWPRLEIQAAIVYADAMELMLSLCEAGTQPGRIVREKLAADEQRGYLHGKRPESDRVSG